MGKERVFRSIRWGRRPATRYSARRRITTRSERTKESEATTHAERANHCRSKKVRAKVRITPRETLSELRKWSDFAEAKIALSISFPPTAEAVNSQSSPQPYESVLSLREGLEPIFWKNRFHSRWLSVFPNSAASLKDKTKLRKGSTQFFLCCSKSLKLSAIEAF